MRTRIPIQTIFGLALATFLLILLSPKWTVPLAAWFAPAVVIFWLNRFPPVKAYLVGFGILVTSSLVANFQVMPFPTVFFVVMVIITSAHGILPYWINRILWKRVTGFSKTLILPATFVLYEYINSFGGGGTWGMLAYSQANNIPLIQVVSITGIWGLSFLIYWFASILIWVVEEEFVWKNIKYGVFMVTIIFGSVIIWGAIRTAPVFQKGNGQTVRVAAITGNNLEVARYFYEDEFQRKLKVDINLLTQTSPELQEVNKGLVAFVENPNDPKFERSIRKMDSFQDSLLQLAEREAIAGAKIILFSEALFFTTKEREGILINKGSTLARANHVYLLLTMASFLPVKKVEFGAKFIENKALLIDPNGKILSFFFKNKPVPVVEPSVAGDGNVPVSTTEFGTLATSICYDADFPQLMRQAGQKNADVLLLPSGDWKEVSPYHGDMAKMRAVENGFSLVRCVSGARSSVYDFYGQLISARNFFDSGEKVLVAYVPMKGVQTVYSFIGDSWVAVCGFLLIVLVVIAWQSHQKSKANIRPPAGSLSITS